MYRCNLIRASLALLVLGFPLAGSAADSWLQWGGPNRDFTTDSTDLADSWEPAGPPELWRRALGEGYSAILVEDGVLYTHYRIADQEIVVALDAASGETSWEYTYSAPAEGWTFERGAGPHSTPSLSGGRLFAVGSTGMLHCLSSSDGAVLWSHDLMEDYDASFRHRGYSSSPIVHDGAVLLPVGGEGRMVIAFRQTDGSVLWQAGDDDNSYSSPTLIELEGRAQLVVFGANEIAGLDPATGNLLWSHPHATRGAFNISTPLWSADDGLLFFSSAYDGGGRVLQLTAKGATIETEELWFSNQVRIHFGTAIRIGDAVYASSGDFGPAPLTAVDLPTGEILWRDRAFAKSSVIYGDGKLIVLDEDGALGLVKVDREGLEVLSRAQVFASLAWTVPTLVGSTLYLRNREEMVALDLGTEGERE